MDPEDYGQDVDVMDLDGDMTAEAEEEEEDEQIDDLLDALLAEGEVDQDLAERRRRRRQSRGRRRKRGVPTAGGRSAYRPPTAGGFVTQKQLKDAMARVGAETRRNAQGIKTVNSRIGSLGGRVDGVVTVNQVQTTKIGKLEKQMKIDGVLELVESYDGTTVNLYQVLKGAVKSGFLGDAKGAAGNPWVIGGVGFLLRNPGILGSLGGGTIP